MPNPNPAAPQTPATTPTTTPATEAGRAISTETGGIINRAVRAVHGALRPVMNLTGMTAEEAMQVDADESSIHIQEAPNCAEWMESRIHLSFTVWADELFGDGYLTRDERIALSSAIGSALDAFRTTLTEKAPGLYTRPRWRMPPDSVEVVESGVTPLDIVQIAEGAVRPDGTFLAKLIGPGWGSSGYYSPSVLERDGPKVFPAGTLMLWNHPTAAEEADRPEGDMNDLAARTVSPAKYLPTGPKGPGLYADAKAYSDYQQHIDEKGLDTGLSIRADGQFVLGEAEGRKGRIFTQIMPSSSTLTSVDFVTVPGARGGVVALAEAARPQEGTMPGEGNSQDDVQALADRQALRDLQQQMTEMREANARQARELTISSGRQLIREALDRVELPPPVRARLATDVQPVITDGVLDREKTLAAVEAGIDRETSYLASAGLGRVVEGMGGRGPGGAGLTIESAQAKLAEAFRSPTFGMSETAAKRAAEA